MAKKKNNKFNFKDDKLLATNFGPLNNIELNLKPLTILIGVNSTGKSYICRLLYSIGKVLNKALLMDIDYTIRALDTDSWKTGAKKDALKHKEELLSIMDSIINSFDSVVIFSKELNKNIISDFLEGITTNLKKTIEKKAQTEIERSFGSIIYSLISDSEKSLNFEYLSGYIKYSVVITQKDVRIDIEIVDQEKIVDNMELGIDKNGLYIKWKNKKNKNVFLSRRTLEEFFERKFNIEQFWRTIMIGIQLSEIFGEIITSPSFYYLPAERSGLLQGYKTIASAVMSSIPLIGIRQVDISPFTGVVADFISLLLQLQDVPEEDEILRYLKTRHQKPISSPILNDLANRLESEVLNGKVTLKQNGNGNPAKIQQIEFEQKGTSYQLHQTSSMISELAPLVLFLRHLPIKTGDFLIIEEPESHLHPSAQRNIARIIASIVRAGYKVIITTHSDYLLQQLSNLIVPKLSATKSSRSKKKVKLVDEILPNEMEVVLLKFDQSIKGSIYEKIPVTDEGILDESFSSIGEELYNESIKIKN